MTQSSPEHSRQSQSFETIVPPGVGGAIEALRAIATQLGLDGKVQIMPVPDQPPALGTSGKASSPILEERFLSLSQEMWGSPDYGRAALTYLDTKRRSVYISRNGHIHQFVPSALSDIEINGHPFQSFGNEGHNFSEPELRQRAELLFDTPRTRRGDNFPSPFDVAKGTEQTIRWNVEGEAPDKRLEFKSGEITDTRLKKYVNARDIKEGNNFQGAVGKILDVISYAAEAAPPSTSPHRDFQGDLIDTQELRQRMISSGLQQGETSKFFTQRLRDAVFQQLDTLKPYRHGEIVIEGEMSSKGDASLIAISSLAALRQSYQPGVQVGEFLQQFVRKSTD